MQTSNLQKKNLSKGATPPKRLCLLIKRWSSLIKKNLLSKIVLDENIEAFVIYVVSIIPKITIHLARKAQIALLITKKVIIPVKYTNFANAFSKKLAKVLLKQIVINKHALKLINDK